MITKITYGKTINLGDYNSERIDAEYMVGENECPMHAMEKLKNFVATGEYLSEPVSAAPQTVEEKVTEVINSDPVVEEAPKKKVNKKAKKAAKKKTVAKKANITYNREEKTHKSDMVEIINKVVPNWKDSTDMRATVLEMSKNLHGTDMYNHKGELLDSMVETVTSQLVGDNAEAAL